MYQKSRSELDLTLVDGNTREVVKIFTEWIFLHWPYNHIYTNRVFQKSQFLSQYDVDITGGLLCNYMQMFLFTVRSPCSRSVVRFTLWTQLCVSCVTLWFAIVTRVSSKRLVHSKSIPPLYLKDSPFDPLWNFHEMSKFYLRGSVWILWYRYYISKWFKRGSCKFSSSYWNRVSLEWVDIYLLFLIGLLRGRLVSCCGKLLLWVS